MSCKTEIAIASKAFSNCKRVFEKLFFTHYVLSFAPPCPIAHSLAARKAELCQSSSDDDLSLRLCTAAGSLPNSKTCFWRGNRVFDLLRNRQASLLKHGGRSDSKSQPPLISPKFGGDCLFPPQNWGGVKVRPTEPIGSKPHRGYAPSTGANAPRPLEKGVPSSTAVLATLCANALWALGH